MLRFPIHSHDDTRGRPQSIPWVVIAPHEKQAVENHSQSLNRLAARGGLSVREALAVLEDRSLVPWQRISDEEAVSRLNNLIKQYENQN